MFAKYSTKLISTNEILDISQVAVLITCDHNASHIYRQDMTSIGLLCNDHLVQSDCPPNFENAHNILDINSLYRDIFLQMVGVSKIMDDIVLYNKFYTHARDTQFAHYQSDLNISQTLFYHT